MGDGKAYDWDEEDRDDQGDHQAKHSTSKGLSEKDSSDLQWGQKESLEGPDSLLKGDHNGGHGSAWKEKSQTNQSWNHLLDARRISEIESQDENNGKH